MKYKIGELAKLLNISTNTVRRYENQGYIHAVRNEDSGYRYYDEDGVFDITNIRLLRKYGFPHEKLLEMQSYTIQEEIAAYQERMQQMDKEIAYMTYVRHRIKDDVLLMQKAAQMIDVYEKDCVEQIYVLYKEGGKLLQEAGRLKKIEEIIYVFLTIFLYLPKCPQSLILSALRAFCFCGKPHISRSIFLYFRYQSWLKSW